MVQVGPEPAAGEATTWPASSCFEAEVFLPESSSDLVHPVASARLVTRPAARRVRAEVRRTSAVGFMGVPKRRGPREVRALSGRLALAVNSACTSFRGGFYIVGRSM